MLKRSYIKRKKPLKKKSSQTISKTKKELWTIFSIYIRTRDCLRTTGCKDWGFCISCGKRLHFKMLQAGHFIPGRHNANLFYERGVHIQCFNCNCNLHGNTLNYMDALIKLYGEGIIKELRENDKRIVKFTIPTLDNMILEYKDKIKKLC